MTTSLDVESLFRLAIILFSDYTLPFAIAISCIIFMKSARLSLIFCPLLLMLLVALSPVYAQENQAFAGTWIFNEKLSDNTDRQVEASLKAAGEKVKRNWFKKTQDKYRGGPVEQELYDKISYDRELTIELGPPAYSFTYEDDFLRQVFTDNRSQSISLNNLEALEDFSFAHWENDHLIVEARPRDGGFADEIYSLINAGSQLKVELYILPKTFQFPIEITRVYDRASTTSNKSNGS